MHDKTKANRGFFFAFLNPSVFQPIDQFKESVSKLANEIKNSRKADGVDEIFLPGERSEKTKQENMRKDYLDIDKKIIGDIKKLFK
ncbi:MAG: Ldh family oxidoreductase [Alphaproteobacteria bacterium]